MAMKVQGGRMAPAGSPFNIMQPLNEYSGSGRSAITAIGKMGIAHARLKAAALRDGDPDLIAAVRQAELNLDTALENAKRALAVVEKLMA